MTAVAKARELLEEEFAAPTTPRQAPEADVKPDVEAEIEAAKLPRQFVTFQLGEEMFAVALDEVKEIVRMPNVIRVPKSPAGIEGIANLRGSVLPILNLRRSFGLPSVEHGDTTRVVVLDRGRLVGFVVDRMANVVTVEPDRIEPAAAIKTAIDSELLLGILKATDGARMTMVLDPERIIGRELRSIGAPTGGRLISAAAVPTDASRVTNDAAAVEELQLVSFDAAGQEFAFPIENVKEIVQLPDAISRVPQASRHVLGVISLRDRLLPVVSLRMILNLPEGEIQSTNKIVVVSPKAEPAMTVGIVMDSVNAVLRVERSLVETVPALLSHGDEAAGVTAICRLDQGRRIVSVLSAEAMFDNPAVKAAANSDGTTAMDTVAKTVEADRDADEQFVVFRLCDEEYGVPIETVQEIVRVPSTLTHMPKAPAFVEGVINLRGTVLPVIDQRRRFALPPCERTDRQRIMVFMIDGLRVGFIVDSVSEVIRIPARAIDGSPNLSVEQRRLIRRVANLEEQQRIILLLEVGEFVESGELETVGKLAA